MITGYYYDDFDNSLDDANPMLLVDYGKYKKITKSINQGLQKNI